jgi:hypothetical protein
MAFGVGLQLKACFMNRGAQADGGQRVLQRLARTQVHVHVAGGDQRQTALRREFAQCIELCLVVGAA